MKGDAKLSPTTNKPGSGFPQAPNAPGWKEKPKGGAVFGIAVLVAGIGFALGPSEGGRRLTPYLDSVGIPTACTGVIGKEITRRYKAKLKFTDAECDSMETAYRTRMVTVMQSCVPLKVQQSMSYGEWVTYGHWAYNTGTQSFCVSTLGKRLAAGDHSGACKAMGSWTYVTHKGKKRNCRDSDMQRICRGIPLRRDLEVSMCLGAL